MRNFAVSFSCLILFFSLFGGMAGAYASEPIYVYYEGSKIEFPVTPSVINGTMMVPMRKIFETIGARVEWEKETKIISAFGGDSIVKLTLSEKVAYINGNYFELEVAPYTSKGSTLVPMRFVCEALGLTVKWEVATRTVQLFANNSQKVHFTPSDYTDKDAMGDVTQVSLLELNENAKTQIAIIPNNKLAMLKELNPNDSYSNNSTIYLSGEEGKQSKTLVGFDVSSLKGKYIKTAYLRLVNNKNLETNAVRTIFVHDMRKPWEVKSTWLTNGTDAWERPGSSGSQDVGLLVAEQMIFRIVAWEPAWFMDVTTSVQKWTAGNTNNGFMLTTEKDMYLFNPFTSGNKPQLIVEYADSPNSAPLSYKSKLNVALDFLGTKYDHGPWSDSTIGIINSQINADKLGLGEKYLKSLTTFFNDFVDDNGNLKGGAVELDSYYKGALGKALIYMHQRTGQQKYKTALENIRRMFDKLPKVDGIFIDQNTYQSELVYLGVDFLAAYHETYGDSSVLDLALDQTIKLYDKLLSAETKKIPFTLMIKTDNVTGLPKGVGWGRGIGWLYAGMGKMLSYNSVKNNPRYEDLVSRFQDLSTTLAIHQDESGLWRNLIHVKETPLETTGTSLIALGMEYGIQEGVLNDSYKNAVDKAVNGLQKYSRTGAEMGNAFPSNQDLSYTYQNLTTSRNSFGFWLELLTVRELNRKNRK